MSWHECDVLPTFYKYHEPIARKSHKCCECYAPILKGEKHFVATGKWEGYISTNRQHLLCCETCMLIRDKFEGGECIGFGELFEWWCENRREFNLPQDREMEHVKQLRKNIAAIIRRKRSCAN